MSHERTIAELQDRVLKLESLLLARPADQTSTKRVRLAKTVKLESDYPTSGYTFPFIFYSSIADDGKQTEVSYLKVIEANKSYIPEGRFIEVWSEGSAWYTSVSAVKKIFVLEDCETGEVRLVEGDQWTDYVGKIVEVNELPGCFTVYDCDDFDECDASTGCIECLSFKKKHDSCKSCTGCYYIVPCSDEIPNFYTSLNLSEYIGQVIQYTRDGGDGTKECGTVDSAIACNDPGITALVPITFITSFDGSPDDDPTPCALCLGYSTYKLANCNCDDKTLETSDNLLKIYKDKFGAIPEDEDIIGQVFTYKGACYEITDYTAQVATDDALIKGGAWTPKGIFGCSDAADSCPCYAFTPCTEGQGTAHNVCQAKNSDGVLEDLSNYPGNKIARLSDGYCYTVAIADGCSDAVEVVIKEAYPVITDTPCGKCLCRTLTPCEGGTGLSTITTYTDLTDYPDGTVLTINSIDGSETHLPWCFTVSSADDCTSAVPVTFDSKKYASCGDCKKVSKYRIHFEQCFNTSGCSGDSVDPDMLPADIITDQDLSAFVNKWGDIDGKCVTITRADDSATVTQSEVAISGPFRDCEECKSAAGGMQLVTVWFNKVVVDGSGVHWTHRCSAKIMAKDLCCEENQELLLTDSCATGSPALIPVTEDGTLDVTALGADVDATSAPVTLGLPTPSDANGRSFILSKVDSSGNSVTVSATINGGSSYVLAAQYDSVTVTSNGTEYRITGSH